VRAVNAVRFRSLYLGAELSAQLPSTPTAFHATELLRAVLLRIIISDDRSPDAVPLARLCSMLLDELRAQMADHKPERIPLPRESRLKNLCEAFLEDPGSSDSVDQWAARFGMTRTALAKAFRRELGITFGAWQRDVRISKARRRLGDGETVTRVALDLGYESSSAFATMFKRVTGKTPSARVARSSKISSSEQ
jgi:AraC-like DNA-binding protein